MTTRPQISDWTVVAKVGDIRPGEGKMVRPTSGRLLRKPLALFNDAGRYYILNYICPHNAGPIGEGPIEDGIVTCPYHAWSFYADTGLPHKSEDHSISAYEVRVEGDDILVGSLKHPFASPPQSNDHAEPSPAL